MPEEKNNIVRATLQKFIEKEKKQLYKCEHNGCNEKVINSHEISEAVFLKGIADDNQKLFVIDNNFRGNSFQYYFKEKYTKSISIFPGFCKEHDENLFKELDNFSGVFDSTFINKQALRSTKKEIVEHYKTISIAEEFRRELENIPSIESTEYYVGFVEKIKIQKERLARLKIIYHKIFHGLQKDQHEIMHKIFDLKSLRYLFSATIDLSQNNDNLAPIFIYKLENQNDSKLIIGHLNNEDSISLVDKLISNERIFLDTLYRKKKNLILSRKFLESISETTKKILLQNEELNGFGFMEYLQLKNTFGLQENLINQQS